MQNVHCPGFNERSVHKGWVPHLSSFSLTDCHRDCERESTFAKEKGSKTTRPWTSQQPSTLSAVRCTLTMKLTKRKVESKGDSELMNTLVHKLFWVGFSVIWNKSDQIILSGWSRCEVQCGTQNLGDRKEQGCPGPCLSLGVGSWLPCVPSPTIMQLNCLAVYHGGRCRAVDEESGSDSYLPNEGLLLFGVCSSTDLKKKFFFTRRCENSVWE